MIHERWLLLDQKGGVGSTSTKTIKLHTDPYHPQRTTGTMTVGNGAGISIDENPPAGTEGMTLSKTRPEKTVTKPKTSSTTDDRHFWWNDKD